jgi:hypothetical protein
MTGAAGHVLLLERKGVRNFFFFFFRGFDIHRMDIVLGSISMTPAELVVIAAEPQKLLSEQNSPV